MASNAILPLLAACWIYAFYESFGSTRTPSTFSLASGWISWALMRTILTRSLLRFRHFLIKQMSLYFSREKATLYLFAQVMHLSQASSSCRQLLWADRPHAIIFMLSMNLNVSKLLLSCRRSSSSLDIQKRKRIRERWEPQGILASVGIQSLLYLVKVIFVFLPVRKFYTNCRIYNRKPFFYRTQIRQLWETLSKALLMSRLSIDTTHLGRASYAVQMHDVSSSSANSVDLCF